MKLVVFFSTFFTLFVSNSLRAEEIIEPIHAENFRFPGVHSPRTFVWNDHCEWFGQPIHLQELDPTPLDWQPLVAYLIAQGWTQIEPSRALGGSDNVLRFTREPPAEGFRVEYFTFSPENNVFYSTHSPVVIPYAEQLMENGAPRPHVIPSDPDAVRISWQYFDTYPFPYNPIDLGLIELCREDCIEEGGEGATRFTKGTQSGGVMNLLTGKQDEYKFLVKVIPSFAHRIGQLEAYWRERGGRVAVHIGDGGLVTGVEGSFSPHRYMGVTRRVYTKAELEQCLRDRFYYCDAPPFPRPDHDDWIIDSIALEASVNETGVPQKHFQPLYVIEVRNPNFDRAQDPHGVTEHCLLFVPALPAQRGFHERRLSEWRRMIENLEKEPPLVPLDR